MDARVRDFGFLLLLLLISTRRSRQADNLLSPKGVNYEVAALMTMKGEMRDSVGAMDGWDINSVDPCTWSMIACSPDGFVVSLEMASNGLGGKLSSSVGNLSHLQTMLLQKNRMLGTLPPEIGRLSQLKTLDLSGNQFTGEIPSSLGNLTHLGYLRLNKNNFSGQIPEAVAHLAGISFLDLSFNNLSGTIPRILAKDYSVAGNRFLCSSSRLHGCMDDHGPVNGTNKFDRTSSHHFEINVVLSIGSALIVAVLFIWWLNCSRRCCPFDRHGQQDYEFDIGHLKRFPFRELQLATNHFSPKNIIGQGGYGVVYKGVLRNGTLVAVKRLKDPNFTGQVQFRTEVEMIGLALHRNLLQLYGFCMTPSERLLIYPYMTNGSVADRLRDRHLEKLTLDWCKRMHIALGAARGLLYLHEQCNPKIIHRDVKAANILLDDSFEAIVGDFGLAKLLDRRDSHVTTAVRGTVGHIAPEYLSTGQSSEKTDVFGFGILLLELITGTKTMSSGNAHFQKGTFLDWVRDARKGKRIQTLVDKDLKGSFDPAELENAVQIALHCTQFHPYARPRMSEVVNALESMSGSTCSNVEEPRTVEEGLPTAPSSSYAYEPVPDESSGILEPMELSGPR